MNYPHPMDDKTGFEATDEEMGLGMKLVPVNPTMDQATAALSLRAVGHKITISDAAAIYHAMVMAAPKTA